MPKDLDKVRYSHAGHDFHFLWTARKILGLLNPKNNLVAVTIEGISSEDDSSDEKGLLAIDTAEYYESESIEEAEKIKYYQLKYSTVNSDKEWSAPELSPRDKGVAKGTIVSFSINFKENFDKYGKSFVADKFEYHFVTNRPIKSEIKELLSLNEQNIDYKDLPVRVQKVYTRFIEDCKLDKDEFILFLKLLKFDDVQDARYIQTVELETEVNKFIPEFNSDIFIKLKALIYSKAMPEHAKDPAIRLETILHVFGIQSKTQLLPAPAEFESIDSYIAREQQDDIAKRIIDSLTPVVIHASGGVGKSSFAQSLSILMPAESKTVIFDGFANGSYRSPKDQRHLHKNGLVQIINEFSFDGLCLPLLQTSASSDDYLKVFYSRVEEIIFEVRQVSSDAIVLIVLDAADNSEMAAQEYDERASFAKDLLQVNPPDGCKIVALSRTERLDILELPHNTLKIELQSFSEQETKSFLTTKFLDVDDGELVEFHKLTFGNPRVQSYLLSQNKPLREVLKQLGQKGLSSDALIEFQLEQSLHTIKEQSHSKDEIDLLCKTLALLPPMVPIDILEIATNISKSLILSFASDMGLALLIKDESIQFRDEPVESWFRKTFQAEKSLYEMLSEKLLPISKSNPYIASTMPRILYGAEQYEMLYKNAYQGDELIIDDPVQKQGIILQNLIYAIKLAKQRKDLHNLTKLLLETSRILSSRDRHSEFIFDNSDLIATLVGSEFINDFLYRGKLSFDNRILYAHSALMLSMEPIFKAEARSFLRLTNEYLKEWSQLSRKEQQQKQIHNQDIANISLAYLYLFGADVAVFQLNRWRLKETKFSVARIMIKHLIEQNNDLKIDDLLNASSKYFYLLSAMVIELHQVNKVIPKRLIELCLKIVLRLKNTNKLGLIVISIAESALTYDIDKKIIIKLLEKHLPVIESYMHPPIDDEKLDTRDITLRHITLLKKLKNEKISIDDFIPKGIKQEKKEGLELVYGQLFPLYSLKTAILVDSNYDKVEMMKQISTSISKISSNSWKYRNSHNYRNIPFLTAYICIDILILSHELKKCIIIIDWLEKADFYINYYVWINLVKKTVFMDEEIALNFAQFAYKAILSEKRTFHTSYNYEKLARAVLPISKEDAKAYFELAIESNSTLGDDARNRMDALCSITEHIDDSCQDPKIAYDFLQVCEMVENFDSHKFSWYSVINAIKNIDTPSSLAIISRLKDRNTVGFYSTLSPLLNKLLKQKDITPQTYASLYVLSQNDNWNLDKGIENIFEMSIDKDDVKKSIDFLIRDYYLEFDDRDDYQVQKIKKVLEKNGVKNRLIDDLIFTTKKYNTTLSHVRTAKSKDDAINWDDIFLDYEYIEAEEIKKAFKRFRENTKHVSSTLFYEEIRKRVPIGQRVQHLDAILNYDNVHISLEELERYSEVWINIAVKRHIPNLVECYLKINANNIIGSYRLKSKLDICEKLSTKTRKKFILILLENSLNNVEIYHYDTLLSLSVEISSHISQSERVDVLKFGINQFKDDLEDDESDGIWQVGLIPPRDFDDTVGAFIYTCLGSTRPEDRWRAMHTVRRLCELGEEQIIESILKQLSVHDKQSFTDTKYEFYDMHAKLYLFIALARGVKENPQVLVKFAEIFKYYALDWLPHVLIRKYVAEVALELENFSHGTYSIEEVKRLKNVNTPLCGIEMVTSETKYKRKSITDITKKLRMSFGIDWEPYWFEPLANAFGVNSRDISRLAEDWIIDRWGRDDSINYWDKDLRAKHKIYRERDTYHSHGSYPREDDLRFYFIYHAMFCTAGELLEKYPIRYDQNYEEDLWGDWLKSHSLTREDSKWVSDRKDPTPMDLYRDFSKETKDNWQFSVQHEDFDRCLRLKESAFQFLPVSGDWEMNNEKVNINSALVSSDKSHALLRALQTINNPHDFYLAPYRDHRLAKDNEYNMKGWVVVDSSAGLILDEFDPLAKIYYPHRSPAPNIQRLCKLKSDDEKRVWTDCEGDMAFLSEVWGNHKEYKQYGERLQVDYNFLLKLLNKIKKDLLVNVEIKREKSSIYDDENKVYYSPYFKLYLFKKDGTVHELYKHYKIR